MCYPNYVSSFKASFLEQLFFCETSDSVNPNSCLVACRISITEFRLITQVLNIRILSFEYE